MQVVEQAYDRSLSGRVVLLSQSNHADRWPNGGYVEEPKPRTKYIFRRSGAGKIGRYTSSLPRSQQIMDQQRASSNSTVAAGAAGDAPACRLVDDDARIRPGRSESPGMIGEKRYGAMECVQLACTVAR